MSKVGMFDMIEGNICICDNVIVKPKGIWSGIPIIENCKLVYYYLRHYNKHVVI